MKITMRNNLILGLAVFGFTVLTLLLIHPASSYAISCTKNSDCGQNYWGNQYCQDNSSFGAYNEWTCVKPADTTIGTCVKTTTNKLILACGSNQTCKDSGSTASCVEGTPNPTTCTANTSKQCAGNSVYWFNSCGAQGSLYQTCTSNQTCSNGACINNVNNCTPNAYLSCSGNSVYWYDSCGTQQNLYQTCSANQTCSGNTCVNIVVNNYVYHNTKGCFNNIAYWYDSNDQRQDIYKNCNTTGQSCQNGSCVGSQNYQPPVTTTTSYVKHYNTQCSNNDVYWYDNKGSIQDIYKSCSDNNSCTQDTCDKGVCQNGPVLCDGSTCTAGSDDYTKYCGQADSVAAVSGNWPSNLLGGNWFIWIIVAIILVILFFVIFRVIFRRLSSNT